VAGRRAGPAGRRAVCALGPQHDDRSLRPGALRHARCRLHVRPIVAGGLAFALPRGSGAEPDDSRAARKSEPQARDCARD
jgi:hypothetical protein